jgi:hypothetical protein
MNPLRIIVIALAIVVLSSGAATAQERGQFGIGMGYPGSISLVWHIADAVAVRPDFRFRSTGGSNDNETTTTTVAFGISGLWYFARHDALRMYAAPRFEYAHTSLEYEISLAIPGLSPQELSAFGLPIARVPPTLETSASSKTFSGSFGAQYAIHKRFSVFGEAGVEYQKIGRPEFLGSLSSLIQRSTDRPHSWGTQSAVGVIVYFKD